MLLLILFNLILAEDDTYVIILNSNLQVKSIFGTCDFQSTCASTICSLLRINISIPSLFPMPLDWNRQCKLSGDNKKTNMISFVLSENVHNMILNNPILCNNLDDCIIQECNMFSKINMALGIGFIGQCL